MTKAELIKAISTGANMSGTDVSRVLESLDNVVSETLGNGGEITLPGIGKLTTRERAARKGRNPGTGQEIDIPAKTVVAFKPVASLADHVA
jgi:DNA-binding protein HU-beta